MNKSLSSFIPIGSSSGLWSAQKGMLRCTAFLLSDESLCLYSPVRGLSGEALNSLQKLGEVTHILAPNHYHNKGLAEYANLFPEAELLCSDAAMPRLEKQTGLTFGPIGSLEPKLPDASHILEPSGLKTGEIWLEFVNHEQRILIVTDAFKGPTGPPGFVADRVELLGTFPKFGLADKAEYLDWFSLQVATTPDIMIVPCHGSIIAGPTVAVDALSLIIRLK